MRTNRLTLPALSLCLTSILAACSGGSSSSNSTPPQDTPVAGMTTGSGANAVADPVLPRPPGTPCVVQLYQNLNFSGFSSQSFSYQPACNGPYSKIVLEADYAVTAGRQFDRTTHISLGGVNLLTGTTQEPSKSVAPAWHVERDLTEYAPLFAKAQTGYVDLDTIVDNTYNGQPSGSARLLFYPVSASAAAGNSANYVYPFTSGANGRPANLNNSSSVLSQTISFPGNVVRAYLDVIAQSQSNDEFWYTCAPDNLATPLQTCGSTAFRETQISIDSVPAGVAPVYPWIYTGGMDPGLWRNIPAVQALNLQPYRVDLSPFAGKLSDGQPHTVSISVQNANSYFSVLGTLFVYTDPYRSNVNGGIIANTLTAPAAPVVNNQLSFDSSGNASGTLGTTSGRQFQISGIVNSSRGQETITVTQSMNFSNVQTFTATSQNIVQNTSVRTATQIATPGRQVTLERTSSYPLQLNFTVDSNGNWKTTSSQEIVVKNKLADDRGTLFAATMDNLVNSSSYAPAPAPSVRSATQTFSYTDSLGSCYLRKLGSQNLLLTSAIDAASCGGAGSIARMPWKVDPQGGTGFLGPIGFSFDFSGNG